MGVNAVRENPKEAGTDPIHADAKEEEGKSLEVKAIWFVSDETEGG